MTRLCLRVPAALLLLVAILTLPAAFPPAARADDRRPDKTTLTLMALNGEFLWDGKLPEEGASSVTFPWKGSPAKAEAHMKEIANLILRSNPDVISMEEVENLDALTTLNDKFLPGRGYKPYFVQGKDTFTGQDVALLSRIDPDGGALERDDRRAGTGRDSSGVSKNYIANLTVGDIPLSLIGLHLLAVPTDPARRGRREAQAQVIQRAAQELRAKGRQVVILGDLNDWDGDPASLDFKDDKPITNVLATLKQINPADPKDTLINAASLMPKASRYTDFYDENHNNAIDAPAEYSMIDHILLPPALAAKAEDAFIPHDEDPLTVSDHFPVVVRLRLSSPAGK